jgi:hypothetical protein
VGLVHDESVKQATEQIAQLKLMDKKLDALGFLV